MAAKLKFPNKPKVVEAGELEIGQIGQVSDPETPGLFGLLLLRTYEGLVSLNSPQQTWGDDSPLMVEVLPKGTEILLTAE